MTHKTNSSNNQLQSILIKVNSASANKKGELKLANQVLALINSFDQKRERVEPSEINEHDHNYISIKSIIKADASNSKNQLFEKIELFPQLTLTLMFIDFLFGKISQTSQLPLLLKNLVYKLRAPALKVAIQNQHMILKKNNIVISLINKLFDYSAMWKNESSIGFPTYKKLSAILVFDNTINFMEQFESINILVKKIKDNQLKRCLIFEKRLRETEISLAKRKQAANIANHLIDELLKNSDLPSSIQLFINDTWSKLLQLEYVRDDDLKFIQAIETLVMLVASLRPIESKQALNWLMEVLPLLIQRITEGSNKLVLSEEKLSSFLSEINTIHIASISQSIDQSQEKSNDVENNLSDLTTSKEEILRLKPSLKLNTQIEGSRDKTLLKLMELNIYNTLIENTEKYSIKTFTNHYSFKKNNLNKNSTKQAIKKYPIYLERWYNFINEAQLNKLLYISDSQEEYVFVDRNGNKSQQLNLAEFTEKLKSREIELLHKPKVFESTIKSSIKSFSNYWLKFQDKLQKKRSIEKDNILNKDILNERNTLKNNTQISTVSTSSQKEKTAADTVSKTFNFSQLSIGSWVEITENSKTSKCKLAAKIASKDSYIFVDRRGKKLFELNTAKLNQYYEDKRLNLVSLETTNEKTLATVISKTRTLKSDI